ncbi:MAG: hypothetical protein JWR18_899 [Segetibacter sp.]|jgi:hypothetical protein|nr:hypothetical protein [Segetibacter sp.]
MIDEPLKSVIEIKITDCNIGKQSGAREMWVHIVIFAAI